MDCSSHGIWRHPCHIPGGHRAEASWFSIVEQKSRWTPPVPLTDTSFPVPMSLDFLDQGVDPLALSCSALLHVIFILPRLLCGCDCCVAALDCFCVAVAIGAMKVV